MNQCAFCGAMFNGRPVTRTDKPMLAWCTIEHLNLWDNVKARERWYRDQYRAAATIAFSRYESRRWSVEQRQYKLDKQRNGATKRDEIALGVFLDKDTTSVEHACKILGISETRLKTRVWRHLKKLPVILGISSQSLKQLWKMREQVVTQLKAAPVVPLPTSAV